jgi:hypothetical protein
MNLQEFFRQAGFEVRRYSGRGMYGKECVGIEIDGGIGELFATVLETCHKQDGYMVEDLAEAFRGMRTDSMGRGTIVYFPSVPCQNPVCLAGNCCVCGNCE